MLYLKLKKGDSLDIKYQDEFLSLKILDLYTNHEIKVCWLTETSSLTMDVPAKSRFTSEVWDGSPLHFYVLKSTPSTVMLGVDSNGSDYINIKRRRLYNGC